MSPPKPEFDPYALLQALEQHRVNYVIIGAFARIIHGTPETTDHLDITPQTRPDNLNRLSEALTQLNAKRRDRKPLELDQVLPSEPITELTTNAGRLKIVPSPAGTRNGYDDLRRHATRENIGHALKPRTTSLPDLARTLTALNRPNTQRTIQQLHTLNEHERRHTISR